MTSDIFRHIHTLFRYIQPFCDIYRTLYNSCIFRTLSYLKPKIYSELCQVILWHIRMLCNGHILRNVPYSEYLGTKFSKYSPSVTMCIMSNVHYVIESLMGHSGSNLNGLNGQVMRDQRSVI